MLSEQAQNSEQLTWFALATRSRAEKKVAEQLTLQHWETYLPLYTQSSHWSDRLKKVQLPLIPSIVFVRTTERLLPVVVKQAGSTVKVLRYLGKPAVIRDAEIETLRLITLQEKGFQALRPFDLSEGEAVCITKGPFKGVTATYVHHQGSYKVIVCIMATKTCLQLEVAAHAIEKVKKTENAGVGV